MMRRSWRLVLLPLLALFLYALYSAHTQYRFEAYLNSLYITFDDFPADYSKALVASKGDNDKINYDFAKFPYSESPSNIPRKIHFIWFKDLYHEHLDVSKIPELGSDAPDLCRKFNPDYEIKIWNATESRELLVNNYDWFLPTYDNYRYPIQRVDAIKYFVLLHYGGIYMDLDIACRRPLDPLLEFPAWYPRASPLGVNNDLMATRANHPIMELMTKTLSARNKNLIFPYLTIFWATGPQFTSDALKLWFTSHREVKSEWGSNKAFAGEWNNIT